MYGPRTAFMCMVVSTAMLFAGCNDALSSDGSNGCEPTQRESEDLVLLQVRVSNRLDDPLEARVTIQYDSAGIDETLSISVPSHDTSIIYESREVGGRGDLRLEILGNQSGSANKTWPEFVPGCDPELLWIIVSPVGVSFRETSLEQGWS